MSDPPSPTDSNRRSAPAAGSDPPERRSSVRRLALLGGPATRPIAGRRYFPLYGILHHIGRRSGREYATPVVVRPTTDGVFVPLPFGEGTDWYRNSRAAGGVRVTWKGAEHWLADPVVVDLEAAAVGFDRVMRAVMRTVGIAKVVRFDPIDERRPG